LIIIDFHGTIIANVMKYLFMNQVEVIEEDLVRHMVLNSIRALKTRFEGEFGKLVISCDSRFYWRKDFFPYYKIKRQQQRTESVIDWGQVYTFMDMIKKEVEENFSYPVIQVDNAESDDVIYSIVNNFPDERILIASRDHDFKQLHNRKNVFQYNPIDEVMVVVADPAKYLFEHIIKGDSGDSIPNVFSPLDSIALNKRQKPAYQKKIDLWYESGVPEEFKERFAFNKKLVDLSEVPQEIQEKVMECYKNQLNKPKKKLMNYFMEHNLKEMFANIQEF